MKRYGVTAPWARAESSPEVVTTEPARAASFSSDVLVPLVQAVTTGGLLAALAVFILGELAPNWTVNRLKVWGGLALTISAVSWVLLLVDTRQLLRTAEKLTGLDLDGDGAIGKPAERLIVVNTAQSRQESESRAQTERRSEFARFVSQLAVKGTSQRTWEKELGREQYQEFRDVLLKLGWAAWNSTKRDGRPNERRGWMLTRPAAEILERIQTE